MTEASAGPTAATANRVYRLRLRHLRLLEFVHATGSLGAAARELRVSQPAATLLLRELESAFAARLVDRGPRGARLTAAGLHALERLAIALASVARAIDAARNVAEEPLLRVGSIQVAGVNLLPALLARLERSGPPGRIEFREGRTRDLLVSLGSGELDAVIGWMDESLADALPAVPLNVETIGTGRMQVVASACHPLARRRSVGVAELARWRWILPPRESRTHAAFLRLFLSNGLPAPGAAVECPALHSALHLVAATRHLAIAPDAAVAHYAKRGMVAALRGPALDLGTHRLSVMTRQDSDGLSAVVRLREALLDARS
ncbi:MAG TPA: LysR substrate-binding domain-containing protein [Casimicrobiaceae bacterium]|nr:LysR substrate-binding domain-containing protein [Casimicrobiaceae bacterium]